MFLPIGCKSVELPSVEFVNSYSDTTNVTSGTYTFSGVGIGDNPSTNRYVVVAAFVADNASGPLSISSMTVGGLTPVQSSSRVSGAWRSAIYMGATRLPTGTTADIVVNVSGVSDMCALGVWEVSNIRSPVPYDFGSTQSATPLVVDLDTPSNTSVLIAAGGCYDGGGASFSFTGATENFDIDVDSGDFHMAGGSAVLTGAETPRDVELAFSGGSSDSPVGISAVFR